MSPECLSEKLTAEEPTTSMTRHLYLEITGIVQGVGFRPFVFNAAKEFGIKGYVRNGSKGVTIEGEASDKALDAFRELIVSGIPPLALIHRVCFEKDDNLRHYKDFIIMKSDGDGPVLALIPPDAAICDKCKEELADPADPRYNYAFINCTNCGPRFTITTALPYDRKNTTMARFPLCPFCGSQYEDPENRRFHAQPVACPLCGPSLLLTDQKGAPVCNDQNQIIQTAGEMLRDGKIIAIKGLGGYHLACDGGNDEAVATLRRRKGREEKPFALMALSVDRIRRHCRVSDEEKKLLESPKSPIVLLDIADLRGISRHVAPGSRKLGFMLAYTPLHRLLLQSFDGITVMTSGNESSEPIISDDEEAFEKLGGLADFFLGHNRPIHVSCDDSVAGIFRGREYVFRRSRGYAPHPLILNFKTTAPVLATGGHQKNTFCIFRDNLAFLSHHMGDLENHSSLENFTDGIAHYQKLFHISPKTVAFDMHRGYLSSQWALNGDFTHKVPVQHHHAHAVSAMAEWGVSDPVIGIILDGSGLGDDGNLWGCEFLQAEPSCYKRLLHLKYIPLPGGEAAVREPWRTALSYLYEIYRMELFNLPIPMLKKINPGDARFVIRMLEKSINSPPAGSAGRLFDAVSALSGIRLRCSYEGQAAVELQNTATANAEGTYGFEIVREQGESVIDPGGIIRGVMDDLTAGRHISLIAGHFHNAMADIVLKGAQECRRITGIKRAVLSGGVFQNMLLQNKCCTLLEKAGFEVFTHERIPANDGGISLGQAVIAASVRNLLE